MIQSMAYWNENDDQEEAIDSWMKVLQSQTRKKPISVANLRESESN
jgi:hypothetical protein